MKPAVLQGVKVINDPFMWSADDKFFDASLAAQLGVIHPKTIVLPNKDYVPGIVHSESLRNLKYPLDWNTLVEQVGGMPCVLKDAHGGGRKEVYIVYSIAELIWRYNQSGLKTMILQEYIQWDTYARVYCLGQADVHVMRYQPGKDGQGQYHDDPNFSPDMLDRLTRDTLTLCRATGYDMNAVEFAIKGETPYVIEFMNPAPDMDVNSLGRKNFDWMVTHMADTAIRLATSDERTLDRYVWGRQIKPKSSARSRTKAKPEAV
jgi:glutathione synthase/RimK-type ligase-like ATP-grasp enzyme